LEYNKEIVSIYKGSVTNKKCAHLINKSRIIKLNEISNIRKTIKKDSKYICYDTRKLENKYTRNDFIKNNVKSFI
jgi:hypothetical protein